MKYYLVAGEASGDLHGANLMKALKEKDQDASFRYFGGDLMKAAGGELVKHYSEMAFMGFIEVVANLNTVLKNITFCKNDILNWKPDTVILVDFPGFNLKIAGHVKNAGIPVCFYISPKVWAWNQKRVLKIKRDVDHMFCILPFEVAFYEKWGMEVDYVGNPLLDAVAAFKPNENFQAENNFEGKKIIALLPGSRHQEIKRLLPVMLATVKKFPAYQPIVAGAPTFNAEYYSQFIGAGNVPVFFNGTYDILNNAEAAIVASGTATLETALFHVPQVVVYKGHPVSVAIARMLVNLKFISLVNLIMNRQVVKELIQEGSSVDNISTEMNLILNNDGYRSQMLSGYNELDVIMGTAGASAKVAGLIVRYISG